MTKLYCDCCGQDLTEMNSVRLYHLLLDADAAPFSCVVDMPDVCPDCARDIKTRILELKEQKRQKGGDAK